MLLAIIYFFISISLVDRSLLTFFWEFPIEYLVGTLVINILVKYGVIYDLLRSYDLKTDLFLTIILVTFVSFPLSQLIFMYFYSFLIAFIEAFLIFYYFLFVQIEILVVVSDWLLFRIEFTRFEQYELINQPLSSRKVLGISILTNLLSLLIIGFIIYQQSYWALYIDRY